MDYNKKKYLTSKIAGVTAIIVGTIMLILSMANLISILGMKLPKNVGYTIIAHILCMFANLVLIGFGIGSRVTPSLNIRKSLMGESKKYVWFYAKVRNCIGLIGTAFAMLLLSYVMADFFAMMGTDFGFVLFVLQLACCPAYVVMIVSQIISLYVKDERVYNDQFKLISKDNSAFEFYNSLYSKEKMYKNSKYLTSKIAGWFCLGIGITFLIENIYVLVEVLINGLDGGLYLLSGSVGSVLLSTLIRLVVAFVFMNVGFKLGELPVQTIIPSELYSQRKEGKYRWKYANVLYVVVAVILSVVSLGLSLFGGIEVHFLVHPVILVISTVVPAVIVAFYTCVAVYVAIIVLSIISACIKDEAEHVLELNVYTSVYTKSLL